MEYKGYNVNSLEELLLLDILDKQDRILVEIQKLSKPEGASLEPEPKQSIEPETKSESPAAAPEKKPARKPRKKSTRRKRGTANA